MASDIKNVKLGVCKVSFGGKDLGYTKGGVEVSVKTETHKVMIDQFGKTPINEYVMGREVTVKVPLAETTLENMVEIMPGATLVVDGVDPDRKAVNVPTGVGTNLIDIAKPLVLHPIGKPETDKSDDFTVFKAATAGALQFSYKLEDERIFSCEFNGYPDSSGAESKLFAVGDTSAV
ncbi:MAG: hypothetical protein FWF12_00480 [Betaproteobacteria bacterium]|nr:hypothetical protein [Betaproteobacteria bacterium]